MKVKVRRIEAPYQDAPTSSLQAVLRNHACGHLQDRVGIRQLYEIMSELAHRREIANSQKTEDAGNKQHPNPPHSGGFSYTQRRNENMETIYDKEKAAAKKAEIEVYAEKQNKRIRMSNLALDVCGCICFILNFFYIVVALYCLWKNDISACIGFLLTMVVNALLFNIVVRKRKPLLSKESLVNAPLPGNTIAGKTVDISYKK